MADFELIDAHVHTYKSREEGLKGLEGNQRSPYAGTIGEIQLAMQKAGITKSVMVNFLPIPNMREAALARLPKEAAPDQAEAARKKIDDEMIGRVIRRNVWTCQVAREDPRLIPFVSADPSMGPAAMAAEIEDKVGNWGAKGVKMHPPLQEFFADDHTYWPVYEKAQELGVPLLFHSGSIHGREYSRTKRFSDVLYAFPKLKIVLAHLGCDYYDEAIDLSRRYPNAYFDSSAALSDPETMSGISNEDAVKIIRSLGVERVMFGTDYPFFDPELAVQRFANLPLTLEEKRLVGAENARRILKI